MAADWKQWNRSDIIYNILAPVLVILLIVGISQLDNFIGGGFNIASWLAQLSSVIVVLGIEGFLLTVLPRMAVAVVIAVIAKVFALYGMFPSRKPNL